MVQIANGPSAPSRRDLDFPRRCSSLKVPFKCGYRTARALPAGTPATATRTLFSGASFIDCEHPTLNLFPVQCADCTLRFGIVAHLHESKSFRSPCVPISNQRDALNCPM